MNTQKQAINKTMKSREVDVIDIEVVPDRLANIRRLFEKSMSNMSLVPYRPVAQPSLLRSLVTAIVSLIPRGVEPEIVDVHVIPRPVRPKKVVLDRLTGRPVPDHLVEQVLRERAAEEARARQKFETAKASRAREFRPSWYQHYEQYERGTGRVVYQWSKDSNGNFESSGSPQPFFR